MNEQGNRSWCLRSAGNTKLGTGAGKNGTRDMRGKTGIQG